MGNVGKADEHKVAKVFLQHRNGQHCFDKVEPAEELADSIFPEELEEQVHAKTKKYVLRDCVNEEGEVGVD